MAAGRRHGSWFVFVIATAGCLGALGFVAWFWFVEQARGRAALDWPTADGVFEKNAVRGSKSSRHVQYRYTVDGRTYAGWREGFAYKEGPRIPEGAPIKVYVNPQDPADAVVYPGESDKRWPFVSGSVIFAFCFLFAFAHRPFGGELSQGFVNWFGFLVCAGVALGAAWGIGTWCVELKRGFESRSWPTVDGVFVMQGYSTTSSGRSSSGTRVESVYYYYVDGVRYDGFRIGFGWPRHPPKFEEGSAIKVHVKPGDPTMHVLVPGPTNNFLAPLAFAAFLVFFGGIAWLTWPFSRDDAPAKAAT